MTVQSYTPHPKRVLVIEDELESRIFISNVLCAHGYAVIDAEKASVGLVRACMEHPELIILDAVLNKESGPKLYQRLTRERSLSETPVILLSTVDKKTFCHYLKAQKLSGEKSITLPSGFIQKPFEAEVLLSMVKRVLEH